MDVQFLWLQEKTQSREIVLQKVGSTSNLGDLMTKYVDALTIRRLVGYMSMVFTAGRSEAAPRLQVGGSHTQRTSG